MYRYLVENTWLRRRNGTWKRICVKRAAPTDHLSTFSHVLITAL